MKKYTLLAFLCLISIFFNCNVEQIREEQQTTLEKKEKVKNENVVITEGDNTTSDDSGAHCETVNLIAGQNHIAGMVTIDVDGDQLSSEHIIWTSKTQKISSDDFVKITTADEIIYGDGFEANQDFTDYKISHIKGVISIDEDQESTEDEVI